MTNTPAFISPESGLPTALADLFNGNSTAGVCVSALARVVRAVAPAARFAACRLLDEIHTETGIDPPDEAAAVSGALADLEVESENVRLLPPGRPFADLHALVASIPYMTCGGGLLVLAFPGNAPPPSSIVHKDLTFVAQLIGLHVRHRFDLRRVDELNEELAEKCRIATVGDAVLGLTHELSNCLNTILLQTSVVQLRADPRVQEDLAPIRTEGVAIARRLRLLQQFREEDRTGDLTVDLNGELRRTVAISPAINGRVSWRLASDLPPLQANRAAVRRLLRCLLLRPVESASSQLGSVDIETVRSGNTIRLVLTQRPRKDDEAQPGEEAPFDSETRDGNAILEALALESLLRLVSARYRVESRDAGSVAQVVEWDA
jgi:hypothetical protein